MAAYATYSTPMCTEFASRERSALLRIAPHLVRPLPIAIPTYGHGLQGKEVLALGMALYDFLVIDRNRGLHDPDRRIPRCRLMSREECLSEFPGLPSKGLTGAALFRDGQMYSPPRLALAFLRSAAERGCRLSNYLEVTEFLRENERICGVRARDRLTRDTLTIRGRVVINAAGPWAEKLLLDGLGRPLDPPGIYSRDACFVVGRPWGSQFALVVQGETRDPDAPVSRKARHLFIVPWRQHTLVGVWHVVYQGHPDQFEVTEEELREFIREINLDYPPLSLTLQEVSFYNAGLVLFGENMPSARDLSYGKRSRIVDHFEARGQWPRRAKARRRKQSHPLHPDWRQQDRKRVPPEWSRPPSSGHPFNAKLYTREARRRQQRPPGRSELANKPIPRTSRSSDERRGGGCQGEPQPEVIAQRASDREKSECHRSTPNNGCQCSRA